LKIALLGYGKMGHMIEELALQRGHEIPLIVDADNRASVTADDLRKADVAIEFSMPDAAVANIEFCLEAGVPVVVGTTGWYGKFAEVKQKCEELNGSLVYGTNYSVGVNIFFALNKVLAGWMNGHSEYAASVEEIHHTQKLDAPSGTAITIAEGILENLDSKDEWEVEKIGSGGKFPENVLPVYYDRKEGVPGLHTVHYTSDIDRITISHEAFNRKGFALGSIIAAEFIKDKKGIFTPKDIFKFN
jgi:4-hydroxy-tetrahydrodipicolinate reductase